MDKRDPTKFSHKTATAALYSITDEAATNATSGDMRIAGESRRDYLIASILLVLLSGIDEDTFNNTQLATLPTPDELAQDDTAAAIPPSPTPAPTVAPPAPGQAPQNADELNAANSDNSGKAPDATPAPDTAPNAAPADDAAVTPAPDAAVTPAPDAAVTPAPDAAVTPAPDAAVTPAPDAAVAPAPDSVTGV